MYALVEVTYPIDAEPAEDGVSTMYVPDALPEGNTVDTVIGPEIELWPV